VRCHRNCVKSIKNYIGLCDSYGIRLKLPTLQLVDCMFRQLELDSAIKAGSSNDINCSVMNLGEDR
jgi:hypothetical protein